ncbi:MAG: amidase [Alphaproteobacteria bacterium]|nr:amidase [Alphaproteobacteria bacterium]
MDPTQLTIAEAGRAISEGSLSPVALTEAYLERVAALDGQLHSFVLVTREEALAAARARARSPVGGVLHGIPIGLKDIYQTRGIRTTAGSRRYLDHIPEEDAETWARLRSAGAILLGKQETHEFAIGGPDFTLPFEPARNPWNTAHYPAGSSSGSAVAVAASLCAGAMGSDTGGSIRGPAAYCGIVGLKPTYGRVSRHGVFPLSYTLDHCGPLTRTVEDCAIMMQALAGYDSRDPASADVPVPDYRAALTTRLDGLRIGVIRQFHEHDAVADFGSDSTPSAAYTSAFNTACRTLESLGARLVDVHLSPLIDYLDTNRVIMLAEGYALHEKDFRERPQDFGHHMFARLAMGAFLSAADYVEAMRQRRELCLEFARVFDHVDVVISANSTGPAPRIDQVPLWGIFERASYTAPFNLTGSPALSVPIGFEDGLPLAFQIVGKPFDEAGVMRVGHAFEQATEFHRQRPAIAAPLAGRG